MVAAQNMVQTLLGADNSTKGKKVDNNTSRKAATTVSKSFHDWVFEWRDWDKTQKAANIRISYSSRMTGVFFIPAWGFSNSSRG